MPEVWLEHSLDFVACVFEEYVDGKARSAHPIGNIPLESTASNLTLQNFDAWRMTSLGK